MVYQREKINHPITRQQQLERLATQRLELRTTLRAITGQLADTCRLLLKIKQGVLTAQPGAVVLMRENRAILVRRRDEVMRDIYRVSERMEEVQDG
jgi:hypothetical protein